jgi:hypothetical protein
MWIKLIAFTKQTQNPRKPVINNISHLPLKLLVQGLKLRQIGRVVPACKTLRPVPLLKLVAHICHVCRLVGTTERPGLNRGLPDPFQVVPITLYLSGGFFPSGPTAPPGSVTHSTNPRTRLLPISFSSWSPVYPQSSMMS